MDKGGPENPAGKSNARSLTPFAALLVVGACYLAAIIWLGGTERYLNWDEAVYFSQVAPDTHPMNLSASRSRGIAWMIYPMVVSDIDISVLRVSLAILYTALLIVAFGAWIPLLRYAAAWAAALFCFSWITVFYGGEISPNLPSALLSVAAVGFAMNTTTGSPFYGIPAGIGFACLAAVRPTDSAFVALGLGLGSLALFPTRVFRICIGPAAGAAVGWLPWLLEAQERFGGIRARLEAGRELVEGGGGFRVFLWHLKVLDGPLYQKVPRGDVSWEGATWWGFLAGCALLGLWLARKRRSFRPAVVAFLSSLVVFGAYVELAGVARPRYLLPTYALISIPAAVGLWEALRSATDRFRIAAVLVVLALMGTGWSWHGRVLARISQREARHRSVYFLFGDAVRNAAAGRPCALGTTRYGPPVGVRSGCRTVTVWKRKERSAEKFLKERACAGDAVFLLADRRKIEKERRRKRKKGDRTLFKNWKSTYVRKTIYLYEPPVQGIDYCKLVEGRKHRAAP